MVRTHLLFGGRHSSTAVLRSLMTKAKPRYLLIGKTKQRVVLAFGDLHSGRQLALGHCAVGVVVEFRRIVFAVGVIEDSLVGNAREGNAGIVLYRFPRLQAFFQLLR